MHGTITGQRHLARKGGCDLVAGAVRLRDPLHRRSWEKFSFLDAPGLPKFAGFMTPPGIQTKALPALHFRHTAPEANNRSRLVRAGVPEPERAPPRLTLIKALGIDPVVNPGDRTLWSTLVARIRTR